MPNTPNFASILDDAPTEVVRPKPLPIGTYLTRVVGQPRYDQSSRKGTDFVEFQLRLISAEEDVDQEELLESLRGANLQERTLNITFYLTEAAVYRLDEFHEHCGLDLENEDSRRARNEEVINSEVRVILRHETDRNDPKIIRANISRTMPVEA